MLSPLALLVAADDRNVQGKSSSSPSVGVLSMWKAWIRGWCSANNKLTGEGSSIRLTSHDLNALVEAFQHSPLPNRDVIVGMARLISDMEQELKARQRAETLMLQFSPSAKASDNAEEQDIGSFGLTGAFHEGFHEAMGGKRYGYARSRGYTTTTTATTTAAATTTTTASSAAPARSHGTDIAIHFLSPWWYVPPTTQPTSLTVTIRFTR